MASVSGTIVRTRTFRAYLSKRGHANLAAFLGQLTWLWNVALNERRQAYERGGSSVSRYDQFTTLTKTRQSTDDAWQRFPVEAQRSVLAGLDQAFKAFFRRVKDGEQPGFPRYKQARGVRSFSMPSPKIRSKGEWRWVRIKGIGRIRFRGMPEGTVKLLRIVRTARRVNIQFVCETPHDARPDTRLAIGLDLGITARVALTTGERFPGVKIDHSELKRRQRKVSRAEPGSRNRRKKVRMLGKEWQRVREREQGALHELTTRIVREHGAWLAVEDLETRNMMRNPRLARRIAEQQWNRLVRMLSYKAESAGGQLVKVNPRHTSQDCSACGHRPRERIDLSVRVYRCKQCGHEQDRDVNAANNILQRALGLNPAGAFAGTRGQTRAATAASV